MYPIHIHIRYTQYTFSIFFPSFPPHRHFIFQDFSRFFLHKNIPPYSSYFFYRHILPHTVVTFASPHHLTAAAAIADSLSFEFSWNGFRSFLPLLLFSCLLHSTVQKRNMFSCGFWDVSCAGVSILGVYVADCLCP